MKFLSSYDVMWLRYTQGEEQTPYTLANSDVLYDLLEKAMMTRTETCQTRPLEDDTQASVGVVTVFKALGSYRSCILGTPIHLDGEMLSNH